MFWGERGILAECIYVYIYINKWLKYYKQVNFISDRILVHYITLCRNYRAKSFFFRISKTGRVGILLCNMKKKKEHF